MGSSPKQCHDFVIFSFTYLFLASLISCISYICVYLTVTLFGILYFYIEFWNYKIWVFSLGSFQVFLVLGHVGSFICHKFWSRFLCFCKNHYWDLNMDCIDSSYCFLNKNLSIHELSIYVFFCFFLSYL